MRVERIIYCEREGCDTHERTARKTSLPSGWIEVTEWRNSDTDKETMAFCGWECVMLFASSIPPSEVIPWGQL